MDTWRDGHEGKLIDGYMERWTQIQTDRWIHGNI